MGGFDPKKMQGLMKQMGIKQEEIEAIRVIIECSDKKIIIEPAGVTKIVMQGNESWQVTGEAREEAPGIGENDIKLVAEKTGKSLKEAKLALEESNGEVAEAIMKLSE